MVKHLMAIELAAEAEVPRPVPLCEHPRAAIAESSHWDAEQPLNALASLGKAVDQARWVADLGMSQALLGAESDGSLEQWAGRSAAVSAAPDQHMHAEAEFGHSLEEMSLSGSKAFA